MFILIRWLLHAIFVLGHKLWRRLINSLSTADWNESDGNEKKKISYKQQILVILM